MAILVDKTTGGEDGGGSGSPFDPDVAGVAQGNKAVTLDGSMTFNGLDNPATFLMYAIASRHVVLVNSDAVAIGLSDSDFHAVGTSVQPDQTGSSEFLISDSTIALIAGALSLGRWYECEFAFNYHVASGQTLTIKAKLGAADDDVLGTVIQTISGMDSVQDDQEWNVRLKIYSSHYDSPGEVIVQCELRREGSGSIDYRSRTAVVIDNTVNLVFKVTGQFSNGDAENVVAMSPPVTLKGFGATL